MSASRFVCLDGLLGLLRANSARPIRVSAWVACANVDYSAECDKLPTAPGKPGLADFLAIALELRDWLDAAGGPVLAFSVDSEDNLRFEAPRV